MERQPAGRSGRPERSPTREQVRQLAEAGLTIGQIAHRLGISPRAVSYHARKLGIPPSRKYAPRGDWDEIQKYYDAGHSVTQCQAKFEFSRRSWNKAVERGDIVPRPQAIPIDQLLVTGRLRNRSHVKRRLLSSGLKANRCDECGLSEWLGAPLSMALHHVNGDPLDNRLANIRLLCPNCHSQTPNFARREAA